jgi:hypothetical protein
MVPEVTNETFLTVENTSGESFSFPADLVNLSFREPDNTPIDEITDETSLSVVRDYCEGTPAKVCIIRGNKYFARLSAPGYLDATDWSGPFDTEDAARHYIAETYDVCGACGEDMGEAEGDLCETCRPAE